MRLAGRLERIERALNVGQRPGRFDVALLLAIHRRKRVGKPVPPGWAWVFDHPEFRRLVDAGRRRRSEKEG